MRSIALLFLLDMTFCQMSRGESIRRNITVNKTTVHPKLATPPPRALLIVIMNFAMK